MNTNYEYHLRIESPARSTCQQLLSLGENGRYLLYVRPASPTNSSLTCSLTVQREPNKIWIPIVVSVVILLVLLVGCNVASRYNFVDYLLRQKDRCLSRATSPIATISYNLQAYTGEGAPAATTEAPAVPKKPAEPSGKTKRLLSLDAFRGFGNRNDTFSKSPLIIVVLFQHSSP